MARRRADNPRIAEIEDEIGRLTTELIAQAGISEDELAEARVDVYEEIRDIGPEDGIDDLQAAISVLDGRDIEAEE